MFTAMARNVSDESLAEAIVDVQTEALAEEMRPEEVMPEGMMVDEELAEAIRDVQMEALAEEMMPEALDKEMRPGENVEDIEVNGKTNIAVADDKSQDESAEDIEVNRESIIAVAEDVDARHSGVLKTKVDSR